MSILKNELRVGNFTSSECYKLMTNGKEKGTMGKPALEYIVEKNMERRLKLPLGSSGELPALSWGHLMERYVFEELGIKYKLTSSDTIQHPSIPYWVGSPDGSRDEAVMDLKNPYTRKSFCELVDAETMEGIRNNHKDGDKFYWQLVSNAILLGVDEAELIVYCPYKSEIKKIREFAEQYNGEFNLNWMNYKEDDAMPFILDGGHYKNLNIFHFPVTDEAIQALTDRMVQAGRLLE